MRREGSAITRVVVLGAAFGGLEVASTLSGRLGDTIDVVLIDAAPAGLCCEQKPATEVPGSIYDPGMTKLTVISDPEALIRDRAAVEPQPREPLWRAVLGERLRSHRHDRGETLGDIAQRAGVSPQYLSEMERGLKEPSSEMIAAVAGALDVTLGELTLDIAKRLSPAPSASMGRAAASHGVLALAA